MRICQYCITERSDDPVQECSVDGEEYFLHRDCQHDWLKAMEALPASSVLGKASAGHCCELCGSGRYVYRIQLPGEEEAAELHRHCAGRSWLRKRERGARHSWRNDYNCYIGSTEWQRFKCDLIKRRGNRCERCRRVSAHLELHHKHYYSLLGSEQPEDVELLCPKCHKAADEARAAKSRPKRDEPDRLS